jgi:hypothetical protein
MSAFGGKADIPISERDVGSLSYSLPKASIGYARAAMRAVAFVSYIRQ